MLRISARRMVAAGLSLVLLGVGLVVISPFSRGADSSIAVSAQPPDAVRATVMQLASENGKGPLQDVRSVATTPEAASNLLGIGDVVADASSKADTYLVVANGAFAPNDFSFPPGEPVPDYQQLALLVDGASGRVLALTLRTRDRMISADEMADLGTVATLSDAEQ